MSSEADCRDRINKDTTITELRISELRTQNSEFYLT